MVVEQSAGIDQNKLKGAARDLPGLVLIPDNSSQHQESPCYFQMFYKNAGTGETHLIGFLYDPGYARLFSKPEYICLEENLEELTGLPPEGCQHLRERLRDVYFPRLTLL